VKNSNGKDINRSVDIRKQNSVKHLGMGPVKSLDKTPERG
jgi:hypothetical protein